MQVLLDEYGRNPIFVIVRFAKPLRSPQGSVAYTDLFKGLGITIIGEFAGNYYGKNAFGGTVVLPEIHGIAIKGLVGYRPDYYRPEYEEFYKAWASGNLLEILDASGQGRWLVSP